MKGNFTWRTEYIQGSIMASSCIYYTIYVFLPSILATYMSITVFTRIQDKVSSFNLAPKQVRSSKFAYEAHRTAPIQGALNQTKPSQANPCIAKSLCEIWAFAGYYTA